MKADRISYHESVRQMYERIRKDGLTNIWDRYEAQGMGGDPDRRCSYCMGGNRCDLCSNGPCRADAASGKRGVCGIDADGMAMRMMLLRNVMGASTYHYHADQTVRTLRAAARGATPYSIAEPQKLKDFASRLGLASSSTAESVALDLCDFLDRDFARMSYQPSQIVEALALAERKEVWRDLGIFPGGILGEMMVATSSCLTNVDGNYASLALKAMRLSIAMAYQSQIVLECLQDVLFGTPRPHKVSVDLGVLDPDFVNVIANGHEPFLGFAMIDLARQPEWQAKARSVGARGLRVIASIETGQEMIQRWETDDVFFGFTGNWIMQEAMMASGCLDLMACDMNCSMPVDPQYASKYRFQLVPVSELVAFEGVAERLDYHPENAASQASRLLEMAISNYPIRRDFVQPVRGLPVGEAVAGFSTESISEILGGSLSPLLEAMAKGDIKGVVGLVSCTTLRDSGQDVHSVAMAKELIKRDILVLSMGCGNGAMQVAGLCRLEAASMAGPALRKICSALGVPPVLSFGTCTDTGRLADLLSALSASLGVPIKDLPVAAAAPEYMEQKATIDAIFALALGLYTYVNPVPTVTGGPRLVELLLNGCRELTGGVMSVERDAVKAVDGIEAHIMEKRKMLGM
ncbi:MAG TPA: anaerobic carbon-monoxide dehydrogenase catalytic subunit [Methanotrichaceae archaeon]|nr:anaerobic carbon-monoxide dehydrogenase catalytic subunit [Methanotrichaceae archaeon]HQF16764.1 anaerobic carbon-monoxide dehydrogenase catalytic subunit [Methanotrichaceae archaeon]HQI91396.1 anaerobic carbon-monoxide dehydrogenase catalytic subunit [Methanotrichaceae archaeon]HQJ28638.1 anaerobic carbon-monoxide dehydrogenase catalytic subunit [Methanotrichaceae archaeon]